MISCEFEDSGKGFLRHVTVGAIVIDDKNRILLGKRAPHLTNGGKYNLPGGFLDRDENTKECALRELFEETGIKGEIKLLFSITDSPNRPKEDRQNVFFTYLVYPINSNIKADEESSEVKWFAKDKIPPKEDWAFDHYDIVMDYFRYEKEKFYLPIID